MPTESWWDASGTLLHAVSRKMNGPVQKGGVRCLPILLTSCILGSQLGGGSALASCHLSAGRVS